MAKLNAKKRNALPSSDFALPGKRKYPIGDKSHARNALARAANKSPAVKTAVDRKVHEKYPGIDKDKKAGKKTTKRGSKMRDGMKHGHHNAIAAQSGYSL